MTNSQKMPLSTIKLKLLKTCYYNSPEVTKSIYIAQIGDSKALIQSKINLGTFLDLK